jgi:hypothetical protein
VLEPDYLQGLTTDGRPVRYESYRLSPPRAVGINDAVRVIQGVI